MPKLYSVKNQYLGINAHLHSFWQEEGGWHEFHLAHIADLTRELKHKLFPLGYTAGIADSLQIRRSDTEIGYPTSDISLYDRDPVRPFLPYTGSIVATQAEVLTLPEVIIYQDTLEYSALAIYQTKETYEDRQLVGWIELLSPSNKLQDREVYRSKRFDLLKTGVVFVELDYLHESPPTIAKVANYAGWRRREVIPADASPYRITVIDPRPTVTTGKVYLHQFAVDEPVPLVVIPLNDADKIDFNFGAPYHKTIEELFFAYEHVDYSQLPHNFERYNGRDQLRIVQRMVAVIEAKEQGISIEQGPFPVAPIDLEQGLQQIDAYRSAK